MYLLLIYSILILIYLNRWFVLNNVNTVILMLCFFMFFVLNVNFSDCDDIFVFTDMPFFDEGFDPRTGNSYKTYFCFLDENLIIIRRYFVSSYLYFDFIYTPVELKSLDSFIMDDPFGYAGYAYKEEFIAFRNDINLYKKDNADLQAEGPGFYYIGHGGPHVHGALSFKLFHLKL